MTKNEFILCSILFFKKFKDKNIEDVVQSIEGWKPVKGKIEELIFENYDVFKVFTDNKKEAALFWSEEKFFRIDGYSAKSFKNIESFQTVNDVVGTFNLDLEDIV